ncbi:type II toxin-antitoxin system prevent-host-death family antitoxin [Luteibacter sp.]|jgi:prevent-host-death family protein|uniref:type II toxin-antitoxin system Phd/YefM family antitoxin n=1 Tax=Luteibacter sp. TaxID=1886636 RepID=UPI002F41AAE9
MTTVVNIHEAKTHLSRLVEKAAHGESVVIAKAGKPMVRIVSIDTPTPARKKRIGFLAGQVVVPSVQAFNALGSEEIADMFGGEA